MSKVYECYYCDWRGTNVITYNFKNHCPECESEDLQECHIAVPTNPQQQGSRDELVIEKRKGIKHGLYKIFYKEEHGKGGSLAAVGYDREGYNWFAPCNWTSGVSLDWSPVERIEEVLLVDYEDYTHLLPALAAVSQAPQSDNQEELWEEAMAKIVKEDIYTIYDIIQSLKSKYTLIRK